MPDTTATRLAELPGLSKEALRDLWKQLFDTAPSPHLRRDLMLPILAYRLQEEACGSLNAEVKRKLISIAKSVETNPRAESTSSPGLKPGTRLVRQWRDQVHLVNVEEKFYEYKGARYQSLSEIARRITGTRWSGPLFFGIKKNQPSRRPRKSA